MASSNDGGPAFPGADPKDFPGIQGGMTLRDYFAAAALTGLTANEGLTGPGYDETDADVDEEYYRPFWVRDAKRCYAMGDAMIAERNRDHAAQPGQ